LGWLVGVAWRGVAWLGLAWLGGTGGKICPSSRELLGILGILAASNTKVLYCQIYRLSVLVA